MVYKCSSCSLNISRNSRAMECNFCKNWFHVTKCTNLSRRDFSYFTSGEGFWLCEHCRQETFPFHHITDVELNNLSFDSNTSCLCSKTISASRLANLPQLDLLSSINKIPSLNNLDVDQHLPDISNFSYYTIHDFHHNKQIHSAFSGKQIFSALHYNIKSLSANHDKLQNLLDELNYNFSILGLSEIKFKSGENNITNISIPNYNFISKASLSLAGGVGFFVKNDLSFST